LIKNDAFIREENALKLCAYIIEIKKTDKGIPLFLITFYVSDSGVESHHHRRRSGHAGPHSEEEEATTINEAVEAAVGRLAEAAVAEAGGEQGKETFSFSTFPSFTLPHAAVVE